MRKPRFDPETTLVAYWSEKEDDLMYHYPRRPDGHMLHGAFSHALMFRDEPESTLLKELERRGYDLTTLRFSVKLKPRSTP